MQEGLNLNLVLNGATLLGVIGLGVKVYLAGKAQKIEQPIDVRNAGSCFNAQLCEERHKLLDNHLTELYAKVNSARDAATETRATLTALKDQVASIDHKMDALLKMEGSKQ